MSKIIFIFIISLSFVSYAEGNTQIELTINSNLKFKTRYQITIEKNNLYFNSEKIDPVQLPLLIQSIKTLSKIKSEKSNICYAGTFIHRILKNNKVSEATGCLDSKRAQQLLMSIDQFKKSKIL